MGTTPFYGDFDLDTTAWKSWAILKNNQNKH